MKALEPDTGRPLARATARAVAWNYASWLATKALVLVTTAVLARLLTPDDFGVIGFATVIVTYLAVMRDLGLGGALIHRRDDVDEAADTVFWINVGLGVVLTAVTAMIAPWVAAYFEEPAVTPLLRVLGLTFLVQSAGTTHLVRLQRDLAFSRKIIPDVAQAAVRAVAAVAAAMAGLGVWSLVIGQLAGVGASAALAWVVMPWRPRLRITRRLVRPLTRFGAPLLGVDVIHAVAGNLDYLVVGKVLGATALGIYTLAYRLPELLLLGVVSVANRVVFPAFASVQENLERLRRGFLDSIRYVQIVVVPIGLGLIVAADPIVRVTLGDGWLEAVPVMRILAAFALVSSSMVADGDVYKALGRPDLLAKVALIKLVLLVPALLIGVRHGLVGVALAHLVTTVIAKSVRAVIVARMLDVGLRRLAATFRPSATAGAAMVGALVPAMAVTSSASPALQLSVAVTVGAVVYAPVIIALEREALAAAIRLFRSTPPADIQPADEKRT